MSTPKPIYYNLIICDGTFDGDTAGFESSTPFIPFCVGDYFDHEFSSFAGEKLPKEKAYRVTAVKHSYQEVDTYISQYVHICVELADAYK